MNPFVAEKEISVSGSFCRTARLRHEWCDFFSDPRSAVEEMRRTRLPADLVTFVAEIGQNPPDVPYRAETASIAVLPVTTFVQWWEDIGFKTRNKIRKSQKNGLDLRIEPLTEEFSRGVEAIYAESPIRQGRKFFHYGQSAAAIQEELGSFLDRSTLVGCYHAGEMIGFMKLFQGEGVLRTIHIIAKTSHRDKCAMDALIAKAVELCEQKKAGHLHYGSWTEGGIGVFREKHLFRRLDLPRYFAPLNARGHLMLALNLQRPLRERLPAPWIGALRELRTKWNARKVGAGAPAG